MPYSIDAIARITGISAFTLRNWEKRYEFLKPKRLGNGFRAYDDRHVELLRKLSILLRHGAKIGDLADTIRQGKPLPEIRSPELAPEVEARVHDLYSSLLSFDQARSEQMHAGLERDFAGAGLLDQIYSPLLSRLGRDRNTGEATQCQEHFARLFVHLRLARLLVDSGSTPTTTPRSAVCATSEADAQELPLLVLAAHLKMRGWNVHYLGSNLPVEEMLAAATRIRPRLVCLSFAEKHGIRQALKQLSLFECQVCIGGFGALTFDADEKLPEHVTLFKDGARATAEALDGLQI